jgi:DNA-binding CsgD family transcriptional regulator
MDSESEVRIEFKKHVLTPKVEEAFGVLGLGKTYQDAADELSRDIETIKSHGKIIREVFQAASMLEAVTKAVAKGIITITEKGGKTLLLALFMVGTGLPEDHEAGKIKIKTRIKIERRINEF